MAAFRAKSIRLCLFPALALCAVVIYFVYAAIDRIGLEVSDSVGTVTGKQFVRGWEKLLRQWSTPVFCPIARHAGDLCRLTFLVNGENTSGLVSKQQFQLLNTNDSVPVKIRRTKLPKRLQVVEVRQ